MRISDWSSDVCSSDLSILAPLMLLYQSRSVAQVLLGADSGWPAADREADAVSLSEAWAASWWICVTGCLTLGATYELAPDLVYWVLAVAGPAILAPFLINPTRSEERRVGKACCSPCRSRWAPVH